MKRVTKLHVFQDSYFLSAEECITAADFQNKYPNICRWSSDGVFGSKFVTVVVTGDKENQIHFEGYQVCHQISHSLCVSLLAQGVQCLGNPGAFNFLYFQ